MDDAIAYVRVWCMGRCGRYSQPKSEPKRCTKCGGEVLCVPITAKAAPVKDTRPSSPPRTVCCRCIAPARFAISKGSRPWVYACEVHADAVTEEVERS